MGYLHIPASTLGNFSKAVISIWFRIPSAVFAAAEAFAYPSSDPDARSDGMAGAYYNPPLYRIIPLLTFGSVEHDDEAHPVQPSFIGVDCVFSGTHTIACNLQTPVNGSITTERDSTPAPRPGCFYMGGGLDNPGNASVAADVWHHILISFDISGSCSVDMNEDPPSYISSNTFMWALDDVNRAGVTLEPAGNNTGSGANKIVCNWLTSGLTGPDEDHAGDTASFSGGYIASNGNPIGIPTSDAFVSNAYNIQLAYVQVFTGVTANTSTEEVRRAFVRVNGTPETNFSIAGTLSSPFIKVGTINAATPGPDITP